MANPSERFNDHGVHAALSGLRSRVAEIPKDLRKEASTTEPEDSIDRLGAVVEYLEAVLSAVDPRLVTSTMLASLESPIQQARAAVDALIDQSDPNQAQAISNATEAALDAIGSWPMTAPMASQEARKAASELGRASKDRLRQIKRDADETTGEVAELRSSLDESKQQVNQTMTEQLNQINATVDQVKAEVDAEKARATEIADGIQGQFNTEQESRNTEFEALKTETQSRTDDLDREVREESERIRTELVAKAEETTTGMEDRGEKLLADLEQKRQQAVRLVDLVATSSTAGAFGKDADEQRQEADKWRTRAIQLGLVAGALALFAICYSLFGNTTVSLAIAKAAGIILFTGLATYAARQSGHHREREVRARKLEQQMVAFGPMTEPLKDPDAVRDVRKDFIERMFPGDTSVTDHSGDTGLTKEDVSLVGQLLREVKNAFNN